MALKDLGVLLVFLLWTVCLVSTVQIVQDWLIDSLKSTRRGTLPNGGYLAINKTVWRI